MTLPIQKDVELPLLFEIEAMGGEARPLDVYPKVTAHFPQITEADLKEKISSGVNKWTNRIQWAR
ncbi:MAG: winged helix-turn-helix domain-containing protein [Dehalococcoidia bacterium]|nr:winged helix-turn-helix domain-containing protein [Dehalococcoidia bacterium]